MAARYESLRFTKEEIGLLRNIKAVEEQYAVSVSLFKAAPFVKLFEATDPSDLLVTVTNTDWEDLAKSIASLGKWNACLCNTYIQNFRVMYYMDRLAHPNKAFVEELMRAYNEACRAEAHRSRPHDDTVRAGARSLVGEHRAIGERVDQSVDDPG